MPLYWGVTRHFFLLTLYNFKNIGGGGRGARALLRGPCNEPLEQGIGKRNASHRTAVFTDELPVFVETV